jgi:hypothetical protein
MSEIGNVYPFRDGTPCPERYVRVGAYYGPVMTMDGSSHLWWATNIRPEDFESLEWTWMYSRDGYWTVFDVAPQGDSPYALRNPLTAADAVSRARWHGQVSWNMQLESHSFSGDGWHPSRLPHLRALSTVVLPGEVPPVDVPPTSILIAQWKERGY